MFRLLSCFLAGALAASASSAASSRYYALELKGGSQVFSVDLPLKKGRVLVFHRYPDGTFMSLSASEVEKVVAREGEPPKSQKFAPGETVYVGNAVEGPGYGRPKPRRLRPPGVTTTRDTDTATITGGAATTRGRAPRPPGPPPPSRIGPRVSDHRAAGRPRGPCPRRSERTDFRSSRRRRSWLRPTPVARAAPDGRARGGGRRRQRRLRNDHGRGGAARTSSGRTPRRRDGARW